MRSLRAAITAAGLSLALVAPAAAAQYDLGGFVGPVTLTHYVYESNGVFDEVCPIYLCLNAVVASGQDASGQFFARLVQFNPTFDVAAFNNEWQTHVNFEILTIWFAYTYDTPHGPTEDVQTFSPDDDYIETDRQRAPITAGPFNVEYVENHLAYDGSWMEAGGNWGARFEPTSVTQVTAAPEPTTVALLGGGLLALGGIGAMRRRQLA